MKIVIDQLANNRLQSALISQQSALERQAKSTTKLKTLKTYAKKWDMAGYFELEKISHSQGQLEAIQPTEDSQIQQQQTLTELYQDLAQQLTKLAFDEQNITKRTNQHQLNLAQITQDLVGQMPIGSEFLSKKQIHRSFRFHLKSMAKLQSRVAQEINRSQIRIALAFVTKAGDKLEEVVQQLEQIQIQQIQKALEQVQVELCNLMERQKWLQEWTASFGQAVSHQGQNDYYPNLYDSKKPIELTQNQIYIQKNNDIEYRLSNLQENMEQSKRTEAPQSVSKTIERLFQGGIQEVTSKIQIDLGRNKFDDAQQNQGQTVVSMGIAVEYLYQAEEKMIQTDNIRQENMIDKLTRWEDLLLDTSTVLIYQTNLKSQ